MTSPLQAAHDQAVQADAAPEPVICTVAAPRRSVMGGVYLGEELRARCPRPGAYDAMALPSLFSGQKRDPLAPRNLTPKAMRPEAPLSPLSVRPIALVAAKGEGPPETPALASPETSPEDLAFARAALRSREAQIALWHSYLQALQARAAFDALAAQLRPLVPREHMPAL